MPVGRVTGVPVGVLVGRVGGVPVGVGVRGVLDGVTVGVGDSLGGSVNSGMTISGEVRAMDIRAPLADAPMSATKTTRTSAEYCLASIVRLLSGVSHTPVDVCTCSVWCSADGWPSRGVPGGGHWMVMLRPDRYCDHCDLHTYYTLYLRAYA